MTRGRHAQRPVTATHLWCPHCQQMLPKEQFGRDKQSVTGYQYYCRGCKAAVENKALRKSRYIPHPRVPVAIWHRSEANV